MALTKPIPAKLKQQMEADPYYHRCCVTGLPNYQVKIDWHHNFESYLHGNKGRVNEAWCILPLADWVHRMADRADVKQYLDWIMLNRATEEELARWSNINELFTKQERLNKLYANQENHPVLHPNQGGSVAAIDF